MAHPAEFAERAVTGDLTVGIIGLGYVGLPTAIGFHETPRPPTSLRTGPEESSDINPSS